MQINVKKTYLLVIDSNNKKHREHDIHRDADILDMKRSLQVFGDK